MNTLSPDNSDACRLRIFDSRTHEQVTDVVLEADHLPDVTQLKELPKVVNIPGLITYVRKCLLEPVGDQEVYDVFVKREAGHA